MTLMDAAEPESLPHEHGKSAQTGEDFGSSRSASP
jgi:hypothetical protein